MDRVADPYGNGDPGDTNRESDQHMKKLLLLPILAALFSTVMLRPSTAQQSFPVLATAFPAGVPTVVPTGVPGVTLQVAPQPVLTPYVATPSPVPSPVPSTWNAAGVPTVYPTPTGRPT